MLKFVFWSEVCDGY